MLCSSGIFGAALNWQRRGWLRVMNRFGPCWSVQTAEPSPILGAPAWMN